MELVCGLETVFYQQTDAYLCVIESEGCAKQLRDTAFPSFEKQMNDECLKRSQRGALEENDEISQCSSRFTSFSSISTPR